MCYIQNILSKLSSFLPKKKLTTDFTKATYIQHMHFETQQLLLEITWIQQEANSSPKLTYQTTVLALWYPMQNNLPELDFAHIFLALCHSFIKHQTTAYHEVYLYFFQFSFLQIIEPYPSLNRFLPELGAFEKKFLLLLSSLKTTVYLAQLRTNHHILVYKTKISMLSSFSLCYYRYPENLKH